MFALAALALLVRGGEPEAAGRPRVVGVLTNAAVALPAYEGFRAGLAEMGGPPVSFLYGGVVPGDAALAAEARRLVAGGADLILTLTTRAAQAALEAGRERGVPVVFAPASNPLQTGLAQSLRYPGGNATGVTFGRQEARRLEWLLRLVPDLESVYIPYTRDDPSPLASLPVLREAAKTLGVSLAEEVVDGWEALRAALARLPAGTRAILVPADPGIASHSRELAAFAMEHGVALSMPHREGVEQGALMSYGFNLHGVGRQAARQALLVLSGVPPAEIPVELAEFSLSVNLEAAHRIGLDVSPLLLRQAYVVAP
ncbi:ABC transporter substrate-binding protein [Azospirillum sp.]|uniref:ABC transporter substrate-binding protein n=1 Tax=Azospirillum sp. TaxID=34012 RepID=UPI003D704CF8